MNEDIFIGSIRSVSNIDRKTLPRLSYSGMEVYKNCPFQFDLKYNKGKRTNETTIALETGSLIHRVLEEKAKYIINNLPVNYDDLVFMLKFGVTETDGKTKDIILGIDDLKKKYFEEWFESDNASGMNYSEKMKVFEKVIKNEMEDTSIWRPVYAELPFEFVYKNRVIFNGFIDRVDLNKDGDFRVIDYKTSKKSYPQAKLSTSLQFGVYALAIYYLFGKLPIKFEYRFVLIDETQEAMTKGWEKRLEKNLDKLLDKIDNNKESGIFVPSPSPLCAFCNFSATNPKAKEHKTECEYYSLWTPDEKRWDVNKRFNMFDLTSDKKADNIEQKRKLIF